MVRRQALSWGMLLCLSVLTLSPTAVTQTRPDGSASQPEGNKVHRRKARKRLARLRHRVLKNKVGLDDKQIEQVLSIFEAQQAQRHAYEKQIKASRQAMRALFKANSDDQAAFAAHMDTLQSSYRGIAELRDEQLTAIRKVLQPKEQAKLLRAMELVKRKLERRRRNKRRR